MLTRRQSLALLASTGALPLLSSCGPNRAASGEDNVVRVYWWGGELRNELTREALELFDTKNPDISTQPEYSDWNGYWDKLATQTASGAAPDLIQQNEDQIDSYGTRGSLLDLEEVSDVLDLSAMDESMLETGRLADGTLVGAPVGIGIFSTGVNPDILEQAGVAMPDDSTWTWDDLLTASRQVSEWARGAGEDIVGLDYFGTSWNEIGPWARQSGEELFPRDDETLISKDSLVAYLEYALELAEVAATPGPDVQIEDFSSGPEQQPFATNRAAFHFQFHTQIQTYQTASGAPLQLLRLPARSSGNPRMVNKASMYWSISATSTEPEAAAAVADFLLRDSEAAKVLKIERGVTAIPELQDQMETVLNENEMVSLDFARDMQAEVVKPPRVTPASGVGFSDDFARLAQESLFGNRTPSDVADEILELLQGMQPDS